MATMKAVRIHAYGGPEVLHHEENIPLPTLEPEDILIRVRAAGVNRPDALQRAGAYAPPKGASDLPGLEAAGEVAAVGPGGSAWAVGDPVTALLPGGGYAEYALTHQDHALPVPEDMEITAAAGLCETFFTVWSNVFLRGRLAAGESFLVHGGSSGIGTTAIQLAKAFGATVIATAGSEEKCEICRKLGADLAINYREADFVQAVRDFTDGRGTDLILDMVGGSYIERNYDASAEEGRIVQIAFLGGPKAEVNFAKLMVKRLTHTGSTLRPRSVEFKGRIARELEAQVMPLIEAGKVLPVMHSTFALEEAAKAHALMESGDLIGKIVLEVSHEG